MGILGAVAFCFFAPAIKKSSNMSYAARAPLPLLHVPDLPTAETSPPRTRTRPYEEVGRKKKREKKPSPVGVQSGD